MHRVPHPALLLVVHARCAHHRVGHLVGAEAGVGDDLAGGGDHQVGHRPRTARPVAYVGACDHRAVQIRERHPQPATADVDAERVAYRGSGA